MSEPENITVRDAAIYMGVDTLVVYRAIQKREIGHLRTRRRGKILIPVTELEKWKERQFVAAKEK